MKKFTWLLTLVFALSLVLTRVRRAPVATDPLLQCRSSAWLLFCPVPRMTWLSARACTMRWLPFRKKWAADKFEFVYSEGMFVVDDAAAAIRDYATQGYNLVIAHGSQYGSSLQEIAPDFPKTSFAWGTTVDTFGQPNIFAYESAAQEGGYVNGVLAATLSKSKIIGIVAPIETGDAKLYVEGFKQGVAATDPSCPGERELHRFLLGCSSSLRSCDDSHRRGCGHPDRDSPDGGWRNRQSPGEQCSLVRKRC